MEASVSAGSNCFFGCKRGFELRGPRGKKCLRTGAWSDEAVPLCVGKLLVAMLGDDGGWWWWLLLVVVVVVSGGCC